MSTLTKPQAHILRVIVKKIFRICPRYYGWCLLFALFKSLETLSRILLPTLLLDEMTHSLTTFEKDWARYLVSIRNASMTTRKTIVRGCTKGVRR